MKNPPSNIRLPGLQPNSKSVIGGGGHLLAMSGAKLANNPSRGGRTSTHDERLLAGDAPIRGGGRSTRRKTK